VGIIEIVGIPKMGDVFGVVGKIWGVGIIWEGPDMRSNLF
jgi:hypothetical protein